MNAISIFFIFFCLFCSVLRAEESRQIYVVYMGAIPDGSNAYSLKESHIQLLSSVLRSGQHVENTIVRRYEYGFSGFAARLSKEEAAAITKNPNVVSVFADPIYQLHTTRSWEFLRQSMETDSNHDLNVGSLASGAEDTIVGLLDTGIWPESKSFDDSGMTAIPSRWKGTCMHGPDFSASNCNKKLIGARYYDTDSKEPSANLTGDNGTPRDESGHGTHTASTAAGAAISDVSYYGLAPGTAKGGSPTSRIAMYKVCGSFGCAGSALLAGFDDAIADGVDLLSVSIGSSPYSMLDFSTDPIAIGSFHAVAKGITVACSAGNSGPDANTVVNAAPWILTVAATTIDRLFESDVVLGGNNKAIKGEAINFSNLSKSADYPLIDGGSAQSNSSTIKDASHCEYGSLDGDKIKGKIILCKHSDSDSSKTFKIVTMQSHGAVGTIFADETQRSSITAYIDYPVTKISLQAADSLFTYINSTKNPSATILPSVTVENYKPAPTVAYFSSRGPCSQTKNILKPDIAAPGVTILASWIPQNGSSQVPSGQEPSSFNLVSGTSMACPHVAGVAATVKSWNPSWSPAAIRSAIMTTATQANNDKGPLTTDSGSPATPYEYGAGEVSPTNALQPGLVYEATAEDYLQFLCNYGYKPSTIKLIATIPDGFECSTNSSEEISNLNYPSIAISKFGGKEGRKVSRVLTNVGAEQETVYTASVKAPQGLDVMVSPDKLQFTKNIKKLSYQVMFSSSSSSLEGDHFGSITWSDGTHKVRSPFVVTST